MQRFNFYTSTKEKMTLLLLEELPGSGSSHPISVLPDWTACISETKLRNWVHVLDLGLQILLLLLM